MSSASTGLNVAAVAVIDNGAAQTGLPTPYVTPVVIPSHLASGVTWHGPAHKLVIHLLQATLTRKMRRLGAAAKTGQDSAALHAQTAQTVLSTIATGLVVTAATQALLQLGATLVQRHHQARLSTHSPGPHKAALLLSPAKLGSNLVRQHMTATMVVNTTAMMMNHMTAMMMMNHTTATTTAFDMTAVATTAAATTAAAARMTFALASNAFLPGTLNGMTQRHVTRRS